MGFVSNSSSSSYVIIGKWLEEIDEDLMENIEKSSIDFLFDENKGSYLVGKIVSQNSDDDCVTNELDLEEIQREASKTKDQLLKLGIDPEDVKIYHTYM